MFFLLLTIDQKVSGKIKVRKQRDVANMVLMVSLDRSQGAFWC